MNTDGRDVLSSCPACRYEFFSSWYSVSEITRRDVRIAELEAKLKAAEEVVSAVKFAVALGSYGALATVLDKYEQGKV